MNLEALYHGAADAMTKHAGGMTNTPALPTSNTSLVDKFMQGGREIGNGIGSAFESTKQLGKNLADPDYRANAGKSLGSSAANMVNGVTHNGFVSGLKNGYRDTSIKNTLGNFWNDYKPWIIGGGALLGGGALMKGLFGNNEEKPQQQPITINNNLSGPPITPRQFSFDKPGITS